MQPPRNLSAVGPSPSPRTSALSDPRNGLKWGMGQSDIPAILVFRLKRVNGQIIVSQLVDRLILGMSRWEFGRLDGLGSYIRGCATGHGYTGHDDDD